MTTLDPITIEVIGASLASIVDEAGETLIRASHSTNIKERRDCSTALFNAAGETLCQAEHIPIHLGSFLDLVPHIMRRYPTQDIRPGDAFIGNDAYEGGGTHLPDIVLGEALMDYAERKMRAAIAAMPDGTWRFEDVFDNEEVAGLLPLAVEVTVKGDAMSLAFEAPEQMRAGINMTYTALLATTYYIVKSVMDPTIPPNAGLARPLSIAAPQGSILNCVAPAAVNGRLQTCQRVADMILGALAQAIPERVMACSNSACIVAYFIGKRPQDGSTWVYLETIGGGSGARATKDGLDGVHVHTTNTSNLPVEALEIEYPLTLMRYELVEDSGGVGQYRGGMGLRRVYQATHECRVRVDITRQRSRSWGLFGGGAAVLKAGQWFAVVTPGAGGFGPPTQRDRTAAARDLAEGAISPATAQEVYGVSARP